MRGIVSVERVAELAEVDLYEFLYELHKRGIKAYPYIDEELREELKLG